LKIAGSEISGPEERDRPGGGHRKPLNLADRGGGRLRSLRLADRQWIAKAVRTNLQTLLC
jgi:hypothetical protein